jgi:hypothetical protein
MKNLIVIIVLLVVFNGCGGSSSKHTNVNEEVIEEEIIIEEVEEVVDWRYLRLKPLLGEWFISYQVGGNFYSELYNITDIVYYDDDDSYYLKGVDKNSGNLIVAMYDYDTNTYIIYEDGKIINDMFILTLHKGAFSGVYIFQIDATGTFSKRYPILIINRVGEDIEV